MTTLESYAKLIVTSAISFLSWIIGGFDILIYYLLGVMSLNYVSGILLAIRKKNLSSRKGLNSLIKKLLALVIIVMGNVVDEAVLGGGNSCRTVVISFYISNEMISVLENLSELGLPIPYKLKTVLQQFDHIEEHHSDDEGDSNQ